MICPECGAKDITTDFCTKCDTNLVLIRRFLARRDAHAHRSRFFSKTGLVSLTVSEGLIWTMIALVDFVLLLFLATVFIPRRTDDPNEIAIVAAIVAGLMVFCGVPLLLGLVLLLKDLMERSPQKITKTEDS